MDFGVSFLESLARAEGQRAAPEFSLGAAASPILSYLDRNVEIISCLPDNGREPTRYFVTRYCRTLGPSGAPEHIPPWRFVLSYIDWFDTHLDLHLDKTRQMLMSWLACACFLHRVMVREGYAGLMGSQQADLIDDGGDHSTTDSLFGRIRYIYEHLPEWMREYAPVTFTHMRITCPTRRSYIVGDSRKGNIGRGGTYDDALVDEAAYVELSEASHRSLRPAARRIIYQSTPNGRKNTFGRIRFNSKTKFRRVSFPWWLHPERREALYFNEDGNPRSPWYDEKTADLSDEQRAREYDIDYTTSLAGIVYKEFTHAAPPRGHVKPRASMQFDPSLPLGIGIDFGHSRKTAAVLVQPCGSTLRVIADYEGRHRGAGPNARDLEALVRSVGFKRPLHLLELIPDPSARVDETGSGHSILSYYQEVGFTNWRFPMLSGPRSVLLGITLVREKFVRHEIEISDSCSVLLDRIEDYRYPTDKATDDIKSNNPVHDMASHIMDSLRYAVSAYYRAAGESRADTFTHLDEPTASGNQHDSVLDYDDEMVRQGVALLPTARSMRG